MQLEMRGAGEQAGRAEAGIDRAWGPMGREEGQERSGEDSSPVSCLRVWGEWCCCQQW